MSTNKRQVIFLRHAQSAEKQAGQTDKQRTLTDHGMEQSLRVGNFLQKEKFNIDLILASSAIRTKTTAQLIADALHSPPPLQLMDEMYQDGVAQLAELIQDKAFETALIVGHNPSISMIITHYTSHEVYLSPAQGCLIEFSSGTARLDSRMGKWIRYIPEVIV
jgi:phosphohistidine phosphatase